MDIEDQIGAVAEELYSAYKNKKSCPPPSEVTDWFKEFLGILFPELSSQTYKAAGQVEHRLKELTAELERLMLFCKDSKPEMTHRICEQFVSNILALKETLLQDVEAIYKGDPAARSRDEVIRTYPGFYATAAYRLSHWLYQAGVPMIPRIISEHAHSLTGIDIHPGARIGNYFCIDHGTGIVIGETTEIGDWVKIYQGVTLGALSVKKEDAKRKRHPTIDDYVVLYAGASILGGNTHIGSHSVIGGNVWLTESVPPGSKIYYDAKHQIKND